MGIKLYPRPSILSNFVVLSIIQFPFQYSTFTGSFTLFICSSHWKRENVNQKLEKRDLLSRDFFFKQIFSNFFFFFFLLIFNSVKNLKWKNPIVRPYLLLHHIRLRLLHWNFDVFHDFYRHWMRYWYLDLIRLWNGYLNLLRNGDWNWMWNRYGVFFVNWNFHGLGDFVVCRAAMILFVRSVYQCN